MGSGRKAYRSQLSMAESDKQWAEIIAWLQRTDRELVVRSGHMYLRNKTTGHKEKF